MQPSARVRQPFPGLFFFLVALGLLGLAFACGESDPGVNGGTGGDGGSGSLCAEACDAGLLCLPDGQGSHSCRCTGDSCLEQGPHSFCDSQTRRCVFQPGTGGTGGDGGAGGEGGAGGSGGGEGPCTPTTIEDPACQTCLEAAVPACFDEVSIVCSTQIGDLLQCAFLNGCMVGTRPDFDCTMEHCPMESMALALCSRQCPHVAACF